MLNSDDLAAERQALLDRRIDPSSLAERIIGYYVVANSETNSG